MMKILRLFPLCFLLCSGGLNAATLPLEKVQFYFPVAVRGEITQLMDKMVNEFESEHPGIDIEPVYAGTYKETLDKVLTANKNGTPPTLAVLHAVDIYTLLDADAIVPFDSPAEQAWLKDFYPAFMTNSRAAGKTWGIPFQRSVILLYWNKRAFREAGLESERPPRSWDEMRDMAHRLTLSDGRGGVKRWGVQIPASAFAYWLFQGLVTTNGGRLMNESGTETYFDYPAAVAALEYWVGLSRTDKVHPAGIVEWGNTPDDFIHERAAMIWTTSGNLSGISRDAGFEFGTAELPANKAWGGPTGGGNFYIFKNSSDSQRESALKFIKWMTDPQRAAQWSIATGYIAVRKNAWETDMLKQYVHQFPLASVARASLEKAVPEFSTHENQRITKVLNDALAAALTGRQTPRQALGDAQQKAMRILRPYQR
jgi:sn-glycerol 3-phosphate transport system substrate-binding protein